MREFRDVLIPVDPEIYSSYQRRGEARFCDVVVTDLTTAGKIESRDVVLIGFPSDEGVRRNDGRPGASKAPASIRRQLARLFIPEDIATGPRNLRVKDLGDIRCSGDLEEDQKSLGRVVGAVLTSGAFPVLLGGGHETVFGHYLGYAESQQSVRVVNIDAHFDVKPLRDGLGHSGSPFRQIIEHQDGYCVPGGYLCIGVQEQSNNRDTFTFMENRKLKWLPLESMNGERERREIDKFVRRKRGRVILTVDMDGIRQADSPGVSAPSPVGLSANSAISIVRQLGASGISSMEVVECNPALDRDDQTTSLAALLIWNMLVSRLRKDGSK